MARTTFKDRLILDGKEAYDSLLRGEGPPIHATGDDIGSGGIGTFQFEEPMRLVRVVKSADCLSRFKIGFNKELDSSIEWEEDMGATERRLRIDGVLVDSLSIWSEDAVTYGTDFVVYGWS